MSGLWSFRDREKTSDGTVMTAMPTLMVGLDLSPLTEPPTATVDADVGSSCDSTDLGDAWRAKMAETLDDDVLNVMRTLSAKAIPEDMQRLINSYEDDGIRPSQQLEEIAFSERQRQRARPAHNITPTVVMATPKTAPRRVVKTYQPTAAKKITSGGHADPATSAVDSTSATLRKAQCTSQRLARVHSVAKRLAFVYQWPSDEEIRVDLHMAEAFRSRSLLKRGFEPWHRAVDWRVFGLCRRFRIRKAFQRMQFVANRQLNLRQALRVIAARRAQRLVNTKVMPQTYFRRWRDWTLLRRDDEAFALRRRKRVLFLKWQRSFQEAQLKRASDLERKALLERPRLLVRVALRQWLKRAQHISEFKARQDIRKRLWLVANS